MSDPAGEQKLVDLAEEKESDDSISFVEFLESRPPGAFFKISDLLTLETYSSGNHQWLLNNPRLHLHCDSDECSGLRYFRFLNGDRRLDNNNQLQTFITYLCSNCRKTHKMYALFLAVDDKSEAPGKCYKHGEMPPFGPVTPPRLLKMLDRNRDLFMKGRRCESQGLGVGAFVYYRRVVEDQRASIIGEIIRVAKVIGAPSDTVAVLEAAKAETQFSKSLDMIKDAIPESLRIQGHNPMTLLHDNLSMGLHVKSDADCLEIAGAIRVVLAELADRLTNALKDEAELTKALGKLLNKK